MFSGVSTNNTKTCIWQPKFLRILYGFRITLLSLPATMNPLDSVRLCRRDSQRHWLQRRAHTIFVIVESDFHVNTHPHYRGNHGSGEPIQKDTAQNPWGVFISFHQLFPTLFLDRLQSPYCVKICREKTFDIKKEAFYHSLGK